MSVDLGFLVLSLIAIIGLYFLFKNSFRKRQAYEQSWRELADRNGLHFELQETMASLADGTYSKRPAFKIKVKKGLAPAASPEAIKEMFQKTTEQITGDYRGHPIKVGLRSTSADDTHVHTYHEDLRLPYTWIVTAFSRTGDDTFALRERNRCSVLDRPHYRWRFDVPGKALDKTAATDSKLIETQTGDPDFDRRFHLESYPQEFATRVLGSFEREKLLRADQPIELKLEGNELMFLQKDILTDVSYLQSLLDMTADLAEAIEQVWQEANQL
ncbi:MAG: hypothetical protein HYY30_05595 [Chloroflexi bacterium]|nr:hypothetical protein [Chloroflexota bacterium]